MSEELIEPYSLVLHDKLGSTNDEAKKLAQSGADSYIWVMANQQTEGRGRRSRPWVSEKGNFFGSLILRLDTDPSEWGQLSFVASLAVRDALAELSANKGVVSLKWPNDVLYNDSKVAGLLLESSLGSAENPKEGEIILGIGVNLCHAPDNMAYKATSFFEESSFIVSPRDFLPILVKYFDEYFRKWQENGFGPIKNAWMEHANGLNKLAKVNLDDKSFEGVFLGLASDGSAIIKMPDGTETNILAGDIFPLD